MRGAGDVGKQATVRRQYKATTASMGGGGAKRAGRGQTHTSKRAPGDTKRHAAKAESIKPYPVSDMIGGSVYFPRVGVKEMTEGVWMRRRPTWFCVIWPGPGSCTSSG